MSRGWLLAAIALWLDLLAADALADGVKQWKTDFATGYGQCLVAVMERVNDSGGGYMVARMSNEPKRVSSDVWIAQKMVEGEVFVGYFTLGKKTTLEDPLGYQWDTMGLSIWKDRALAIEAARREACPEVVTPAPQASR